MISENVQVFWAALQRGEFITDAAEVVGTYRKQGARWVIACGGVRPRRGRNLQGRYLCFAEREEIALARAAGESMRSIAARHPQGRAAPLTRGHAGPYQRPPPHVPAPLRSTRTSDSACDGMCCDDCQNPPTPQRTALLRDRDRPLAHPVHHHFCASKCAVIMSSTPSSRRQTHLVPPVHRK
ncbi:MAG TPA: helix-turn-helix domain-containing protein [Mycobacterium sp.]|nr:helix-turn-helix domain-containing protein [Mycobacterium sp.]